MRYEHSICRYDQEDVIRRVFALMGFPSPPPGKARQCAEEILKPGGFIERAAPLSPNGSDVIAQRGRLAALLVVLDAPKIKPTAEQVADDKQAGQSLCVVSAQLRSSVEIHAGIGAIYYRTEGDSLISQVAPITGSGMDRRRDYLLSVIETTRDTMEQTFS
jgi:hypothetical protein